MTKANSLEPPRLATWLFERFSSVLAAPLAGDLIESFRQGRSSGWYWRQVVWAILMAFLQSLRKQPGRLAYAIVCGGLISAIWSSMFHVTTRVFVRSAEFVDGGIRLHWERTVEATTLPSAYALYAKSYGIQWPWSLVYQITFITVFQALAVAVAVGAYLQFARILKAQNFLRALMVVALVLASGNVAATFLNVPPGVNSVHVLHLPQLVGWAIISMPTILALLVGMWMGNPGLGGRPASV